MTVLVPKAGEPAKKENADEPAILEQTELGIEIPPEKANGEVSGEMGQGNPSEVDIRSGNFKKSKILVPLSIWCLCLFLNNLTVRIGNWTMHSTGEVELKMIQVSFIVLYSLLYLRFKCKSAAKNELNIDWLYYWRFVGPVVLCMLIRSLIRHQNMWTSPMIETLSLSVDIFLPFCVLVGSAVILASDISYTRIVPLGIVGCLIYAFLWNSRPLNLEFKDAIAFAILFTLEIVFSKKVMEEKRVHPLRHLVNLGCLSLCILLPICAFHFVDILINGDVFRSFSYFVKPESFAVYLIHGFLCWAQTAATFTVISMQTPFEFSIGNLIVHLLSATTMFSLRYYIPYSYGCDPYFD